MGSEADKYMLLKDFLIGLLYYQARDDTVRPEHAGWLCEHLSWHKVLPLSAALCDQKKLKCRELETILHSTLITNILREEAYRRQAHDIISALTDAKIDVLPFKGPFWVGDLYKAYHWRHIGDLDLLISKQDLSVAASVLAQIGYEPQPIEGSVADDLARRGELAFFPNRAKSGGITVELHWDPMPSPRFMKKKFLLSLDFTQQARQARWQGISYLLPRPEIQLYYYMLHASCQHQFMRFVHLTLLAHFIQKHPELNWDWLETLIVERNAQVPVVCSLTILNRYWPLPDAALCFKENLKPLVRSRLAPYLLSSRSLIVPGVKCSSIRRNLFRAVISW